MTKSPARSSERSFAQVGNNTFTNGLSAQKKRIKQMRRENGWDSYVKPISKYNEVVHSSMKINFERI